MTEKLKKCPLCGGEVEIRPWANPEYYFSVDCKNCMVSVSFYRQNNFDKNKTKKENAKINRQKTIDAWNTREADENPALTIDELKEINADMDNRPWVWIEVFPEYRLFNPRSQAEPAYYRVQADYTEGKAFCCGYPGLGFYFKYEDYGKTWLTYKKTLITSTNH